jgi:hypothetical protein
VQIQQPCKHTLARMSESIDSVAEAKAADQTANKDPELFVNGLTHDSKPGHAKFTRLLYKALPLHVQHGARNNGGVRGLMDNGVTLSVSLAAITAFAFYGMQAPSLLRI